MRFLDFRVLTLVSYMAVPNQGAEILARDFCCHPRLEIERERNAERRGTGKQRQLEHESLGTRVV
jgi:hypothetical protein